MTIAAHKLAKLKIVAFCLSIFYSQGSFAESSLEDIDILDDGAVCRMTFIPGCHSCSSTSYSYSTTTEQQQIVTQTSTRWEEGNNPWDNVPKDSHRFDIKKGWQIPNTMTWVKLGGMFKLDAYHDIAAPTGDPFEAPFIAPKSSIASKMNGSTKLLARQTNFSISTITESRIGEIKGYLEADFANNNYYGSYGNRQHYSLNSIGLRLREVFVENQGFLFGQTATTFSDKESNGYTLIHNGPSGNSQLRLPMIRYTWYDPLWTPKNGTSRLMIAAESPTTDYLQYSGADPEFFPLNNGTPTPLIPVTPLDNDIRILPKSRGMSPLPNITAQLRFEKKGLGHIAFRGLGRYLRIRPDKITSIKDAGWGLGVSGRLFVTESDSLFFNYSAGKGIGHYIFDMPGQSLAYDSTTKKHVIQFGQGIILGFEHYWTDHLRSNVIVGISQVNNARFLKTLAVGRKNLTYDRLSTDDIGIYQTDVAFVNRRIQHVTANLIYKPTAALEFGIEYNHARRTTISGQNGIGKRVQVSCIYRF